MKDFVKKHNLTEDQFYGKVKIGGSLYLSGLTSIPEGFNPTVGGSLYLSGLTSIPEGFNPTVGGYLYLSGLTSIPEGFNPTVGGSLYLRGLTSIPEGFNPTVGGYLYLNGLTSIPEGFNPTVGGSLYLNGLTSIPEGFNPTVGGSLYLRGLTSNYIKLDGRPLEWLDGKYISVDGIFTEVINKRGNISKVKKLNSDKEFYLVSDGNGKYAHGDTLQEAKDDLIYKISCCIDKEVYREYDLDTTLSFDKGIECYRVITGACSFGTKDFVISNNIENKIYSIREIIELTKGRYGHNTFEEFFGKNN